MLCLGWKIRSNWRSRAMTPAGDSKAASLARLGGQQNSEHHFSKYSEAIPGLPSRAWMLRVFFGDEGIADGPLDADRGIVPQDAPFILRTVEIAALVED